LKISAYIIFYNNKDTILDSVNSIISQTHKVSEIILIDDGSTDNSYELLKGLNFKVYRNKKNRGRGFSRRLAHKLCSGDFILSLDATNVIDKDFLSKAVKMIKKDDLDAIYGRIFQKNKVSVSEKWRSTHLYKDYIQQKRKLNDDFITYGSLIRKDAYEKTTGYQKENKFYEDSALGFELIKNNSQILFEPTLLVYSISKESIFNSLERYTRWYSGTGERPTLLLYFRNIIYSLRHMVIVDIKLRYYSNVLFSLLCPHFQYLYQYYLYFKNKWKLA